MIYRLMHEGLLKNWPTKNLFQYLCRIMNCDLSICAIEGALRWNNHKNKKQANKQEKNSTRLAAFFFYLFFFFIKLSKVFCVFSDSYQPDFGAFFHFMSCSVLISLLLQYPTLYHFCLALLDLKHMWTLYSASLLVVKIKQKKGEKWLLWSIIESADVHTAYR